MSHSYVMRLSRFTNYPTNSMHSLLAMVKLGMTTSHFMEIAMKPRRKISPSGPLGGLVKCGHKAVIEQAVRHADGSPQPVRSFVRNWLPGPDSSDSEDSET
jgi:hypothetical protein